MRTANLSKTTLIISLIILVISMTQFIRCNTNAQEGSATDGNKKSDKKSDDKDDAVTANASKMIEEGRETFRFETFGDEAFWTDALQLNKAIAGDKHAV